MKSPLILAACLSTCLLGAAPARAEPTTGLLNLVHVRPYMNAGAPATIYFTVDRVDLCGTDTYAIDMTWTGSKEAYAALMAALVGNFRIRVEIANTGCNTPAWATRAQSIYVVK